MGLLNSSDGGEVLPLLLSSDHKEVKELEEVEEVKEVEEDNGDM